MKLLARKILAWAFQGRPDGVIVLMTHPQYARWKEWHSLYCELRNSDKRFMGPIKPPKVDHIGRQTRAAVEARSDGKCELQTRGICTKEAQDIHHVHFKSNGGTNELENLLHTCLACHHNIHQPIEAKKNISERVKESLGDRIARAIKWR